MTQTLQDYRRVFVSFEVAGDKLVLRASLTAPAMKTSGMALVSRGMLMAGPVEVPMPLTAVKGDPGASAYQVARDGGYGGTQAQWLTSLKGADGASAYELARAGGYGGTATQWLAGLKGADGKNASALLGSVTIAETAIIAIAAGVRRRPVTIPVALGAKPGDALLIVPKAPPPPGFVVQGVWASATTTLSVDLTVPPITIGGSYSIDCWLFRLTI